MEFRCRFEQFPLKKIAVHAQEATNLIPTILQAQIPRTTQRSDLLLGVLPRRGSLIHRLVRQNGESVASRDSEVRRLVRGSRGQRERDLGQPRRRLRLHVLNRRIGQDLEKNLQREFSHAHHDPPVPNFSGERHSSELVWF